MRKWRGKTDNSWLAAWAESLFWDTHSVYSLVDFDGMNWVPQFFGFVVVWNSLPIQCIFCEQMPLTRSCPPLEIPVLLPRECSSRNASQGIRQEVVSRNLTAVPIYTRSYRIIPTIKEAPTPQPWNLEWWAALCCMVFRSIHASGRLDCVFKSKNCCSHCRCVASQVLKFTRDTVPKQHFCQGIDPELCSSMNVRGRGNWFGWPQTC